MSDIAAIQRDVRHYLLTGESGPLLGLIRGGRRPEKRLAIHQRQYRVSLVTSLLDRFPATVWLVGSDFASSAAEAFVRRFPPTRPCIAEYGEDFPTFLAERPGATGLPYLKQFAALEWQLVRTSLAIDLPAVTAADLRSLDPDELARARLILQPGSHYSRLDWALDELITLYLTDHEPTSFRLASGPVFLEVRGARGETRMTRLSGADFACRAALAHGHTLGEAMAAAQAADQTCDPGSAFVRVIGEGLITGIHAVEATTNGGGA